ncbi:MAG TPA: sugar transferase [Aggregatilineales bacterium]|nr:sugar transferase [Aggregatilineales bacterium]
MTSRTLFSLLKEMAQIRFLSLVTIVWFTLLFNIERLDVNGETIFNLSNVTYGLAIIIGLALLALPNLGIQSLSVTAVIILVLYVVTSFVFLPDWLERSGYIYALEIGTLLITLVLMRRVSYTLLDFEEAYQVFVLDIESSRIMPGEAGKQEATRELDRARRFNQKMTLVFCKLHAPDEMKMASLRTDSLTDDLADNFERRYRHIQLARSIAALSYTSDIIIDLGDRVVVCLPDTSIDEADGFVNELRTFVDMVLEDDLLIGVSAFPENGVLFDDLVEAAQKNARIYKGEGDITDTASRQGALLVDIDQRLKIEQDSAWLQKLTYQSPSARIIYQIIKRAMDIIVVTLVMPVILPVLGIVALLIVLDDGRPVFYMQERTGYGGRRFKMFKFRSMRTDAKAVPPKIVHTATGEVRYVWPEKTDRDDRITRMGRFIRKTSLDELPQLLNVLKGDMSIVGPRPTTWEVKMYTLHQTERLTVRPGITGLWQVCARESTNFDERLLWDLKYVEKMSLWLDFQIIFRTVAQVFKKGGV